MAIFVPRRSFLLSMAALPAAMMVASSGEAVAQEAAVAAPEPKGTVDVARLMQPGPLPEKALGSSDAPVTIVEYSSMTCSHCAHFHNTTLPELKSRYIETGKVRLILREFPFDPRAEAGFMLARCSEDNYFTMIEVLFREQERWATARDASAALLRIARLGGFSQESFKACLTNQQLLDDVRAVRQRGQDEFKVDSTPTFFINGARYLGAMSIAEFSAILEPLLR